MFYLVFFYKICFDRRRRLEVKQWCYSGVRNGRMTWSIPLSSFSALVTGETSLLLPIFIHIWADHARETQDGKILFVGWCNVTAICWKICFLFMLSTLARSRGGCLGRHYYEIRSFATSLLCRLFEFSYLFLDCRAT